MEEEEKGPRPFDTTQTAATEGWTTLPWPYFPRAELTVSFGGPVAEEKSNLCYTFGMANDEAPVEKALTTSSSSAITCEDSVNNNLATLMEDSGASDHYFDDANICDLERRLQEYVHLALPRKILTVGGAMLKGIAEGVLQNLVTDNACNKIVVRVDIVVVPGIGRNLFSVLTAPKKDIATIFDYQNPRLEGFSVTVPLRNESDSRVLVRDGLEC